MTPAPMTTTPTAALLAFPGTEVPRSGGDRCVKAMHHSRDAGHRPPQSRHVRLSVSATWIWEFGNSAFVSATRAGADAFEFGRQIDQLLAAGHELEHAVAGDLLLRKGAEAAAAIEQ